MKDSELSYIAGLIDGEGSIMLLKQHSSDKFKMPVISMTNTAVELIDVVNNRFPGTICNQKVYKPHHLPSQVWRICYNKAVNACIELLPYLRHPEKIRRAKLIVDRYKQCTPRNGKYTDKLLKSKLKFEQDFLSS